MNETGKGAMINNIRVGGLTDRRPQNEEDAFEMVIARVFGDQMQTDDKICSEIWSALTNVAWRKLESGEDVGYTFRAAGDLIAAIRGSGNYMDWYCSGPAGCVTDFIACSMKKEGWTWEIVK